MVPKLEFTNLIFVSYNSFLANQFNSVTQVQALPGVIFLVVYSDIYYLRLKVDNFILVLNALQALL